MTRAPTVWMALRGEGPRLVLHRVAGWRPVSGKEMRWDPLCGQVDPTQVVLEGGDYYCLACREREDDP